MLGEQNRLHHQVEEEVRRHWNSLSPLLCGHCCIWHLTIPTSCLEMLSFPRFQEQTRGPDSLNPRVLFNNTCIRNPPMFVFPQTTPWLLKVFLARLRGAQRIGLVRLLFSFSFPRGACEFSFHSSRLEHLRVLLCLQVLLELIELLHPVGPLA